MFQLCTVQQNKFRLTLEIKKIMPTKRAENAEKDIMDVEYPCNCFAYCIQFINSFGAKVAYL